MCGEYCREIETYLCKKNDGHLIRVVGPSFDIVSRWAEQGVPLKVAYRGIDRYFERYYRKGPRRRPVKIDFCEADVLDVFDEWRRALGLAAAGAEPAGDQGSAASASQSTTRLPSLPAHLERVLSRLSQARATGALGPEADPLIDRVSTELDLARGSARGLRGEARRALLDRLADLDRDLLTIARASLSARDLQGLSESAATELAPFRARMAGDAYARAHTAAVDRLVREHAALPVIALA